jgi:GT2 family glycosyltransferase
LRLAYKTTTTPGKVAGYVFDYDDPTRRLFVELRIAGASVACVRADLFEDTLTAQEGVDPRCGFCFRLDDLDSAQQAEIRLANLDVPLGEAFAVGPRPNRDAAAAAHGFVEYLGGLRLRGWLPSPAFDDLPRARAWIAGVNVATIRATNWANIDRGGKSIAARGFDMHLPAVFANGEAYQVEVTDDVRRPLDGSPRTIVAFDAGLDGQIRNSPHAADEAPRTHLYDLLAPQSLPFWMFETWRKRFAPKSPGVSGALAVVLTGEGDVQATLASLDAQQRPNLITAVLPSSDGQTAFDPDDLLSFLSDEGASCKWVAFALSGTQFFSDGLHIMLNALQDHSSASLCYADIECETIDGEAVPVAMPAYSFERQLEQGYGALLFAMSYETALRVAKAGPGDLFALFLCVIAEAAGPNDAAIAAGGFSARVPRLDLEDASARLARASQAHLKARGVKASVSSGEGMRILPAARVRRASAALSVSVIVPTRDRVDLLRRCIESIMPALARIEAEVIVVDNGSTDPATLAYLDSLARAGAEVVRDSGPFNYARLNNRAVEIAQGDVLALLNNDIEALDDDWLSEMLSRLVEPNVGAVGAKLLWPSRIVQHGGVILGVNLGAGHAFNDVMDGAPGYSDLLCVAREVSAVTAACLLTRREHFVAVGGFDEIRFPVNFNDVDYCLKQIAAGRRIVFTPHATLVHHESASRGSDVEPDRAARFKGELRALRDRWSDALAADRFYSPMLSLDGAPYGALAWPPRIRSKS